jgi:hypothetical protein
MVARKFYRKRVRLRSKPGGKAVSPGENALPPGADYGTSHTDFSPLLIGVFHLAAAVKHSV